MISHKYKCIFIHIPKCAGSSVEKVLGHFDGFTGDRGAQDHRALRMLQTPNFEMRCLTNMENILVYLRGIRYHKKNLTNANNRIRVNQEQFEQYFKFAIVRNPWSRAFSWYKNVIRDESHRKRHNVSTETSFKDFLKVHAGKWMLRPQTYWLKDYKGEINFDYIGKFEELPSVLERIDEEFDLKGIAFPHEISGNGEDYRLSYDEEMKELISREYREEIELFGYTFDK